MKYNVINNNWSFPSQINFEMVTRYLKRFENTRCDQKITFDLTNTDYIHSSFVGFLIHVKLKTEKEGGIFKLMISPELEKIFVSMNLDKFLHYIPVKKSA